MKKIMFVCHGNICRSTMAEFVFKHMVKNRGRENEFQIDSTATSREEIGNDTHYGTKNKLRQEGIPFTRRAARQITSFDMEEYDLIIAMDYENLYGLNRLFGNNYKEKIHLLLEYAPNDYAGGVQTRYGEIKEIADPWYTGNFDETFDDILAGCTGLLDAIS